jgi:hypothetical protein
MANVQHRIVARIHARSRGTVFTSKDFLDLGSRAAVDQALSRLVREGAIRRLNRGLFDCPSVSPLVGTLSADPDKVAMAVARKTGGRVHPSGARAANVLGLSTQVPAKLVYLTDGGSKTLRIGNQTLVFKRVAPRSLASSGKVSALVLQALRYLGRRSVDDAVIHTLRRTLSQADKRALARDTRYAADWIVRVVQRIAQNEPGELAS